jgi:hypothetical protein
MKARSINATYGRVFCTPIKQWNILFTLLNIFFPFLPWIELQCKNIFNTWLFRWKIWFQIQCECSRDYLWKNFIFSNFSFFLIGFIVRWKLLQLYFKVELINYWLNWWWERYIMHFCEKLGNNQCFYGFMKRGANPERLWVFNKNLARYRSTYMAIHYFRKPHSSQFARSPLQTHIK